MHAIARRLLSYAAWPLAAAALSLVPAAPALAQEGLTAVFAPATTPDGGKAPMNVKAREMLYDTDRDLITAIGEVQIAYGERRLQADRVVYDRKTQRVRATGNVHITEADGTVTYADRFDLTDDFREGYVESLQIATWDKLRLAANRAERIGGNITVFKNGVYTACEPCSEDPARPPLWQIKAARIIHNQAEKMIYFEDARFEFLGTSIAYLPYLSSPDPSVKRKSGFLAPDYYSKSGIGYGLKTPYFINLAPNYDLTLTPGFTTKQGPTGEIEWRHRLINGSYNIRAAGAFQANPDEFDYEGRDDRQFRGAVSTTGEFWLNERWRYGWSGTIVSDKYFFKDYDTDVLKRQLEATSTLYLTGQGTKSWFEARAYYFQGLTLTDVQRQLPVVHPVIDYNYVVDRPVLGGELGWNVNFTSLSRAEADFDQVTGAALCGGSVLDTTRMDCLQRGIDGTYSRMSADIYWKRTFTDPIGQRWTPFAYLRGDLAWTSIDSDPARANFVDDSQSFQARGVGAIGLDYRYPFVAHMSWGSQVLEPIAQVIVRPRLQQTGRLPNEDAQSLLFDDTNLFEWDKYSGYDRLEDGSRVNVGMQYTLTTNWGSYLNASFGQSYALGGYTPYASGDMANTGLQSGLDKTMSDYVGRLYIQPVRDFAILSSARFDEDNFAVRRLEVSALGTVGPIKADIGYGRYDAQPLLGQARREGVRGRTAIKVSDNWMVTGGAFYDIDDKRFTSRYVGMTYVDACIAAGFQVSQAYDETTAKTDTSVSFKLSLRGLTEMGSPQQFKERTWSDGFVER